VPPLKWWYIETVLMEQQKKLFEK
jgi:hypothetical protein